MIATSRPMQVVAVAIAAGLHVAAFQSLDLTEDVQIAAAGTMQEVALGNAFADLVVGVMTSDVTEKVIEPVTTVAEPMRPNPVDLAQRETETVTEQPDPVELQQQPTPTKTAQTEPALTDTAQPTATEAATVFALPLQNASVAANPVVPSDAPPTIATSLAPTSSTAVAPSQTPALQPTAPTVETTLALAPVENAPAPKVEVLSGEDASITTPLRSMRPSVRPEGLAPPPPQRQDRTTQQQTQPRGNALQNANQGAQTETPRANAAAASGSNANAGQSPAVSNAAVSNYPGQVMRRVSRVRRPRTNARGAAVVAFSIVGSGGLGSLSIARSSGNAELDKIALQVVQRAAPFPPPPSGAQTRFRIEITGR